MTTARLPAVACREVEVRQAGQVQSMDGVVEARASLAKNRLDGGCGQ